MKRSLRILPTASFVLFVLIFTLSCFDIFYVHTYSQVPTPNFIIFGFRDSCLVFNICDSVAAPASESNQSHCGLGVGRHFEQYRLNSNSSNVLGRRRLWYVNSYLLLILTAILPLCSLYRFIAGRIHPLAHALLLFSLLLLPALASASLWLISFRPAHVPFSFTLYFIPPHHVYFFDQPGQFIYTHEIFPDPRVPNPPPPPYSSPQILRFQNSRYTLQRVLGPNINSPTSPPQFSSMHVVCVALWFITGLFALPPLLLLPRLIRRIYLLPHRQKLGLCFSCGYDLRGSKDQCPECGNPIPASSNPGNDPVQSQR